MFYRLIEMSDTTAVFNALRYITFRTGGAVITALIFVLLLGRAMMVRVDRGGWQSARADGPTSHPATRTGTATVGGLMIMSALMVSMLLWANLANPYIWIIVGVTLSFGIIGFYDDILKVSRQSHTGLSVRTRFAIEAVVAMAACIAIARLGRAPIATSLVFPFFAAPVRDLGWFFYIVAALVIVGAGNAGYLAQRLGELAIVPVMIAAVSLGTIAYLAGNVVFANYLEIQYVAGTGELAVLCGAVIGTALGFLWFNAPTATMFMDGTSSPALGAMVGAIAVATKHEIMLAAIGGLLLIVRYVSSRG
jgi:phospho-N-acetylmuramoyl-pentapeptide-transferase